MPSRASARAGLFSLALTIIGDVVPPRERAKYQGYFLAVFGTSSVLGPVIGGFFSGQSSILWISGWRWVFLVNAPIGLFALGIVYRVLHIPHRRREHRIDWPGALALIVGLVPLLTVAEQGRSWGWGSTRALALYVVGAAGIVAWVLLERRIGDDALIPLRFFRDRTFALVMVVSVFVGAAMFGGIALLPLYLQIVQGDSPTKSGLALLPFTLGIMAGSIVSGQLIARTGRYKIFPVVFGVPVLILGMGLLATIGADTPLWHLEIFAGIFGYGLGNVMQPLTLAVQNTARPQDIGAATSSATFFRQIGATIGTAVFLSVLFSTVGGRIRDAYAAAAGSAQFQQALQSARSGASAGTRELLTLIQGGQGGGSGSVPSGALNDTSFLSTADQTLAHPFYQGFASSMRLDFLLGVGVLVLAFGFIVFLREVPLRTQSGVQALAEQDSAADRAALAAADGAPAQQPVAVGGSGTDGVVTRVGVDGAGVDGAGVDGADSAPVIGRHTGRIDADGAGSNGRADSDADDEVGDGQGAGRHRARV